MSFLTTPEFKVGLLVLIVSAIIAGMSLTASDQTTYLGGSKEAWFAIDDASGLIRNSRVRMAGIPVGYIREIRLENGKARVEMILQGDLPLNSSARVEIRPNGILGDKHVELISGDPRDPPLRSGEQILVVDDRASVDRLISEVSKITNSLSAVAESVRSAVDGEKDKPLGRIIGHLERLTGDLSELTRDHKGSVSEILENLRDTTASINELINDDSQASVKGSLQTALKRLDTSMRNIEEITGKIQRGEGTIGKLLTDDTTVEEINTAVANINNLLEVSNKMQTAIDYHSHYLVSEGDAKTFISLRVQPGLDRYYEIGVVDDPRGVTERTVTTTTTDGGAPTVVREDRRFQDRVLFNALFAKNFHNLTVKGGIIENSGGFGFDYALFRNRLRLSVEAFDFTRLNLRASARYSVFHGVYVTAGGEDLASPNGRSTAFFGAGLFLTNDDLKFLLTRMPF
jgi:phospholipid/cholesterol/gamma-HCH transport system substrate-binding protein